MNNVIESLIRNRGGKPSEYQIDIELSKKTWIHRGGKVDYWWNPKDLSELTCVGKLLYENDQRFIAIGHTSNIYFKNSFNIPHIIDTRKLTSFSLEDNTIFCDCGVPIAKVSKWAVEQGLVGYEGLINLPGTVAGAIVNNSGCYNCGIDKILKSVEILTPNGEIENIKAEELNYKFRNSALKAGELKGIILRAFLDASQHRAIDELINIANKNTQNRLVTQDPPQYNLGSTVNVGGLQNNFRNFVLKVFLKLYRYIVKDPIKQAKLTKKIILILYNKYYLDKYISDKRFSCYLWKDKEADKYFDDYIKLVRDVYRNVSVEIQVFS